MRTSITPVYRSIADTSSGFGIAYPVDVGPDDEQDASLDGAGPTAEEVFVLLQVRIVQALQMESSRDASGGCVQRLAGEQEDSVAGGHRCSLPGN